MTQTVQNSTVEHWVSVLKFLRYSGMFIFSIVVAVMTNNPISLPSPIIAGITLLCMLMTAIDSDEESSEINERRHREAFKFFSKYGAYTAVLVIIVHFAPT